MEAEPDGRAKVSTELAFEPATANSAAAQFVAMFATAVQSIVNVMAQSEELVLPRRLTVVVADDFAAEVRSRMVDTREAEAFTTERVGGDVAGKNLPVPHDPDAGVIVLNMAVHDFSDTETGGQLLGALTLAHELFHPPLTWTRQASGALAGATFPSSTPSELARSLVRIVADEYRADMLSSITLEILAGDDQAQQHYVKLRQEWMCQLHRDSVAEALDVVVHPGWPDAVVAYRTHQLSLHEMWARICGQTEQTLTLLAHAEAAADFAAVPPPLAAFAEHPGVVKYLGPVWSAIMEAVSQGPLLPGVRQFRSVEDALIEVGEPALFDMWGSLGLTFPDLADPSFFLHVTDPR